MLENSAIISRTINTLNALAAKGVKFRIELPDGKAFGNLKGAPKRRLKQYRPAGSVKSVLEGFLSEMEIGDVVQIPIPSDFKKEDFRARVCSYCIDHWGKKAYTTVAKKEYIEVLREA